METNQIPRNTDQHPHEHRWTVLTSYWECEICGRTYG